MYLLFSFAGSVKTQYHEVEKSDGDIVLTKITVGFKFVIFNYTFKKLSGSACA